MEHLDLEYSISESSKVLQNANLIKKYHVILFMIIQNTD